SVGSSRGLVSSSCLTTSSSSMEFICKSLSDWIIWGESFCSSPTFMFRSSPKFMCGSSQGKGLAEVYAARFFIAREMFRRAFHQYLAFEHDISPIGGGQGFPNAMVGDKNAHAFVPEV